MSFVIGLLTVVLVLNSLFLILLVLVQLPKKEAGAGMAFGGAATDALFGAGSGNMLTKVTKYAAISFFALTIFVGLLQSNVHGKRVSSFESQVDSAPALPASGAASEPATTPALTPTETETPATPAVPPLLSPAAASNAAPGTPTP